MKKRKSIFYLMLILLLANNQVNSQNKVLKFDGINDYVNLGNSSGNNVRTIECWFKPNQDIDSTNTGFKSLIVRNTGRLGAGDHFEFGLVFDFLPGKSGKLRFYLNDDSTNNYNIYSDNNSWKAGTWYHVAAVIDSSLGMSMYIDGVLQSQTNSYSNHTDTSSFYTAIGRWGDENARYFEGSIDEVRFHSKAVYISNFTPDCPQSDSLIADKGSWSFQELSGSSVVDSSIQNTTGTIHGAIRVNDTICPNINTSIESLNNGITNFLVYPNPSSSIFNFSYIQLNKMATIKIFNTIGKEILSTTISNGNEAVNLQNHSKGIYAYVLLIDGKIEMHGKLIKH